MTFLRTERAACVCVCVCDLQIFVREHSNGFQFEKKMLYLRKWVQCFCDTSTVKQDFIIQLEWHSRPQVGREVDIGIHLLHHVAGRGGTKFEGSHHLSTVVTEYMIIFGIDFAVCLLSSTFFNSTDVRQIWEKVCSSDLFTRCYEYILMHLTNIHIYKLFDQLTFNSPSVVKLLCPYIMFVMHRLEFNLLYSSCVLDARTLVKYTCYYCAWWLGPYCVVCRWYPHCFMCYHCYYVGLTTWIPTMVLGYSPW